MVRYDMTIAEKLGCNMQFFFLSDIACHIWFFFQGDSGGPLQCNMKDGRWYLAGLTSFGSGCAKPGFPDVFTRLTHYLEWINSTLALH